MLKTSGGGKKKTFPVDVELGSWGAGVLPIGVLLEAKTLKKREDRTKRTNKKQRHIKQNQKREYDPGKKGKVIPQNV